MFFRALAPKTCTLEEAIGRLIDSAKKLRKFSRYGRFITELWPKFDRIFKDVRNGSSDPFAPHPDLVTDLQAQVRARGPHPIEMSTERITAKLNHVDPLSLFFGTVLHSLDHQNVFDITKNPFWLTPKDPTWTYIGGMSRNVRVGFLGDHTNVFPVAFKEVPATYAGGFVKRVYDAAHEIDPMLADNMQGHLNQDGVPITAPVFFPMVVREVRNILARSNTAQSVRRLVRAC